MMMVRAYVLGVLTALIALGGVAISTLAKASTLTPDLSRPSVTDHTLSRDGDFDGDGRRDDLYLVSEADTGRIAVHIHLNRVSGTQDIRVTAFDGGATAPDLRVVKAGRYQAECGTFTSDCATAGINAAHDSLMLGLDGATGLLLHWQGDHFEQDFVRSDEAAMAHAFSALYALNR
ncbi:hypothetical protein [Asticcacaulis sp. MM231]|uniref:hypothetical protein n=1 Tax=Asticcacaulis sp. MM231 TaxID=3157666 RepID=UPI0032D5887B